MIKATTLYIAVATLSVAAATARAQGVASSVTKLIRPSLSKPASTANAAATSTNALAVEAGGTGEKIAALPTKSDDVKTEAVLNSLIKQAGWFPDIKIKVSEGMVTFKGKANNATQLDWLAKTADRLPSVIAVINQSEIETPPLTDLAPAYKEFKSIVEKAKKALPLFVLSLLMLAFFYFIARYIHRAVDSVWSRHIANPFLLSTVSKLSMVPVWVIVFYLILQTAGLSSLATTIIGGTGAAGIVLGFAFKGIVENYLSGLLLAIRSPFTKGDEIQVAQFEGYVQSLNMRGTTIIDFDGNIVLIPNSIVIQSVIRNRTTNPNTRSFFTVSLGYEDSVAKAQELIYGVLKNIPGILKEPKSLVVVDQLASGGVTLKILFWYNCVTSSLYALKSSAITQVKEILLANDFSLPDQSQDLNFNDTLNIHVLQTKDEVKTTANEKQAAIKEKAATNLSDSQHEVPEQANVHERDVQRLGEQVQVMKKSIDNDLLRN